MLRRWMRVAAAVYALAVASPVGCTYTEKWPLLDASGPDASAHDSAVRDAAVSDATLPNAAILDARDPDFPILDAPVQDAGLNDSSVPDLPAREAPGAEVPRPDPMVAAFGCPDEEQLVACYTFEESADGVIHDGSGFKHHGTTNAMRVRGGGRQGDGLRFSDGMQIGTVADRSWLRLAGDEATVEAWVRPSSYPAEMILDHVVAKASATPGLGWAFGMGQGRFGGYAGGMGNLQGNVPLNVWSHIAAVWTPAGMLLYQNGRLLGMFERLTLRPGNEPLTIGNRHPSVATNSPPFHAYFGDVDVIRVFNRARTAEEICADAARSWNGSTCSEAPVIP